MHSRLAGMRKPNSGRFAGTRRAILSCLLSLVLIASFPTAGFADVQSGDTISGETIQQRGLTVGQAPDVDAACAILEAADGTVLWERNADTQYAMASTTKIMTAVVAIENMDLDTTVTISDEAASVGDSTCGLVAGTTTTLRNLLHGMLIMSGNDAATQIAISVGGDVGTFVDMMNAKAAELGMHNTHFVNPHGLDADGHYTTPRDFATLARYAMKKQVFRDIVSTVSETIDLGNGPEEIENSDALLTMVNGCIGIKTGTEDKAGYCLVSCVNRDGLELYSVILGASDSYTRFTSAQNLMEWGYKHYVPVTLGDTSTVVALVPQTEWMDVTVPVVCESSKSAYVLDYNGAIASNVSLVEASGNIKAGDVLGSITWTQGDKVVATTRLVASEDVNAPNIFEKISIWFKRTFTDDQKVAKQQVYSQDVSIQDPSSAS